MHETNFRIEYRGNLTEYDLMSAILRCHRDIATVKKIEMCPVCSTDAMMKGLAAVPLTIDGHDEDFCERASVEMLTCVRCGYTELIGKPGRNAGSIIAADGSPPR